MISYYRGTAVGFLGVLLVLWAVSCAADPQPSAINKAGSTEEKAMTIYPKIFADFRHTSFQEQTTRAAGMIRWHCPPGDILPAQAPSVIILTDDGLTVEYPDRLVRLGYDGAALWQERRDPKMHILTHRGVVYYRGTDGFLHGVDGRQKQLLNEFYIPNCFDRGGVQLVFPVNEDHFLIQTYNMAKEVKEDKPPESDDYNFILMGPDDWNDWDWLQEFEGRARPGLITGDASTIVCVNDQNQVMAIDVKTGKEKSRFTVEDETLGPVSLDREDHLIALIINEEGELILRKYNLAGERQWNYLLSAGGEFPNQPPAVDSDNRIYCIVGDSLQVIDQGKLQWQQKVPAASVRYLTIMGDNSVVIAGGIEIDHFDRDGKELLAIELEDGVIMTTPPVADDNGRLYLGTKMGIYCLE